MNRLAAVLLLFASVAASVAFATEPFPHPFLYAGITGGGYPVIKGTSIDMHVAGNIARFPLTTLCITPCFDRRPGIVDTIRALHDALVHRPMSVLAYASFGQGFYYATPGTFYKAFYDGWNRTIGGVYGGLFAQDGTPFASTRLPWVNFGHAWLDNTEDSLCEVGVEGGRMDGWLLDTYGSQIHLLNGGDKCPTPGPCSHPDYARAGFASGIAMDNARQAQVVNLAARIHNHNTLGHRAVMVVNGIVPDTTARTVVDGMMYENWPNFRGFGPGMKAYLAGGKDGVIAVYCTTCNQIPDGSQYNATSCREARFALGSASMGDGYGFFGPAELTPPAGSTYLDWYYDEYSVDIGNDATADTTGAHLGWLGDPLGPATQLTTDVWVRYFNNGAAIVNGSGSPATLTPAPSAGYRKIRGIHDPTINDGSSVTSVTVVPHDALFLLRAQIDHVRPAAVTDLRVGP